MTNAPEHCGCLKDDSEYPLSPYGGRGGTIADRLRACKYPALKRALEESLKLQSHYAELLNMQDGGKRMQFRTAQEWLDRLEATK